VGEPVERADGVSKPASQRAEEALLGTIFRDPAIVPEVMGTLLEPLHFFFRPYRIVYEEIVERYFADATIDPLLVAESVQRRVAESWRIEEREAVDRIIALKASSADAPVNDLAAVIKRHHDYRELLTMAERVQRQVMEEVDDPEAIAADASAHSLKVATAMVAQHEVYSYGDLGRRWVENMKRDMALVASGEIVGAHFGIRAIDDFTKGLKGGELLIAGGEPGVGKSAVWWRAAENFAMSQREKPGGKVGTLVMSLEMSEEPSSVRLAQAVGGVEGEKLRMATLDRDELLNTAKAWARKKDLPLYFNYSGHLRESQLRAIIVDEIRKHNVGLVVIDHFRFIRPDDRTLRGNEADDQIVTFLKVLAKELNVAVVCLAHTVKTIETNEGRPKMSDLRGSGMISAFADFVSFVYRPWKHASETARRAGSVNESDAEMLWEKARHTGEGSAEFYMNLSTMTIH
jgi:replicative DNA helicase